MALFTRAVRCLNQGLPVFALSSNRPVSDTTNLKEALADKIIQEQKTVMAFRKKHGHKKIGDVTVNMAYGGMRGITGLVCETSVLDPNEGIRFRGYTIPECQKIFPKVPGGEEPLPEGVFWLLCTGQIPSQQQQQALSKEWARRAVLPAHVITLLNGFPTHLHPMSQFVASIAALNSESHFAKAYHEGAQKATFWEYIYEDAMDLIAKLPMVAATIYKNTFRHGEAVGVIGKSSKL